MKLLRSKSEIITSNLSIFNIIFSEISSILSDPDKDVCINLYRYVQILEKSFNAYLLPAVIPATIFCVPIIEIIGYFACITLHQEVSMPGFLIFPLMATEAGISNIFVITLASQVHVGSQQVKIALEKRSMGRCKMALVKRQIRAMDVLKIKFGQNFIDAGTPLVMQNFCINQTMSLALVKGRRAV